MTASRSVSPDPHFVDLPRGRARNRRDSGRSRYSSESRSRSASVDAVSTRMRLNPNRPPHTQQPRRRTRSGSVGGTTFDATISPNSSTTTAVSPNDLVVHIKKRGGSLESTLKAVHIVEWNGKKYRLTQTNTENNGTRGRYYGYTENDWEKIAQSEIAIWDELKRMSPGFVPRGYERNENNTVKYRTSARDPLQTIDLNAPATASSSYATLKPLTLKAHELFQNKKIKPRPMHFVHGNGPKPQTPAQQQQQQQRPTPPLADPLQIPPPDPEEIPWYRVDKKIKNYFYPPENNAPQLPPSLPVMPIPAPVPVIPPVVNNPP